MKMKNAKQELLDAVKDMKKQILEITDDLSNDAITPQQAQTLLLRLFVVSGSLPSDEEIRGAADEWVFDINGMKWSNNDDTAGDNYGSFIAGAKWVLSRLSNYL